MGIFLSMRLTTPPTAPPPYNKVAGPFRTSMRSNNSGSVVTAWSALSVEASNMSAPSVRTRTRAPSIPRITGRLAPAPNELPRTPGIFLRVSPRVAWRWNNSCEPSSTSEALTICVDDCAKGLALIMLAGSCVTVLFCACAANKGIAAMLIARIRGCLFGNILKPM